MPCDPRFNTPDKVSINSTSEEVRSVSSSGLNYGDKQFPLIQLPRKSEAFGFEGLFKISKKVSINSTSEEVRSAQYPSDLEWGSKFPLIQLPRKSEDQINPIVLNTVLGFH